MVVVAILMNCSSLIIFRDILGITILNYITVLCNFMTTAPLVLVKCQLIFSIFSIKERVKVLNEQLEFYFPTEKQILEHPSSNKKEINKYLMIDEIIGLHNLLSDAILVLNKTITCQMIPILAVHLSSAIFSLHCLIKEYLEASPNFWGLVFNNFFWVSFFTVIICIIASMGATTTAELEQTSVLVLKIINNIDDKIMLKKFRNFSWQIERREKIIKNAFFSIDWSLVFQVIVPKIC